MSVPGLPALDNTVSPVIETLNSSVIEAFSFSSFIDGCSVYWYSVSIRDPRLGARPGLTMLSTSQTLYGVRWANG